MKHIKSRTALAPVRKFGKQVVERAKLSGSRIKTNFSNAGKSLANMGTNRKINKATKIQKQATEDAATHRALAAKAGNSSLALQHHAKAAEFDALATRKGFSVEGHTTKLRAKAPWPQAGDKPVAANKPVTADNPSPGLSELEIKPPKMQPRDDSQKAKDEAKGLRPNPIPAPALTKFDEDRQIDLAKKASYQTDEGQQQLILDRAARKQDKAASKPVRVAKAQAKASDRQTKAAAAKAADDEAMLSGRYADGSDYVHKDKNGKVLTAPADIANRKAAAQRRVDARGAAQAGNEPDPIGQVDPIITAAPIAPVLPQAQRDPEAERAFRQAQAAERGKKADAAQLASQNALDEQARKAAEEYKSPAQKVKEAAASKAAFDANRAAFTANKKGGAGTVDPSTPPAPPAPPAPPISN